MQTDLTNNMRFPFSHLLRQWMEQHGHEVSTAAPILERSPAAVYQWLDGRAAPRALWAKEIAERMNIDEEMVRLAIAESKRQRLEVAADD